MADKKQIFIGVIAFLALIGFLGAFAESEMITNMNITEIINILNWSDIDVGKGLVFNGSDLFATSTNGTQYTAGTGLVLIGTEFQATAVNGSGSADGIGNSNATLWGMFINISNIMNNATIYDMINAVSDNDTDTDTDTTIPAQSNETIGHFIGTYLTAGDGIIFNGSQITSTAVNGSGGTADTQDYMVFDIRNNKYKGVIWDISDAEADGVHIQASTTTELIFGRNIQ